jgi:hypothetical protein
MVKKRLTKKVREGFYHRLEEGRYDGRYKVSSQDKERLLLHIMRKFPEEVKKLKAETRKCHKKELKLVKEKLRIARKKGIDIESQRKLARKRGGIPPRPLLVGSCRSDALQYDGRYFRFRSMYTYKKPVSLIMIVFLEPNTTSYLGIRHKWRDTFQLCRPMKVKETSCKKEQENS